MNMNMKVDVKGVSWQHLLRTRRYMVIAVALGIGAALLLFYVGTTLISQTVGGVNEFNTKQKDVTTLRRKALALQDGTLIEQAEDRQKIDILLPSKKPLLQLLNNVGTAAQEAQVTLAEIETTPGRIASGSAQLKADVAKFGGAPTSTKINGTDVLQIGLTVNGTLPQINAFLKNIEHITPLSDITQLQLIHLSGENIGEGQYQAKLKIASYYFTQPINVRVDAALPEIKGTEQDFLNSLDTFKFSAETQQENIQGGGLNDLFRVNKEGNQGNLTSTP